MVPAELLAPLDRGGGEVVGGALRLGVDDGLEGEEDGEELLLVADQDGVGDDGQLLLDVVLDGDGGDVLAAGGDQELLDAAWKNRRVSKKAGN